MENILLFGGGLHANSCSDVVEKEGKYHIAGIIDSQWPIGSELYGYKVIGRQEDLVQIIEQYDIKGGIIAIGDNYSRHFVWKFITELVPDFNFVNAIHSNACIANSAIVGKGVVMMAGVIVNASCVIEDFCILNTGALLEHNGHMEAFSLLSVGSMAGGKVRLKKFASVTVGVVIIDRVTIGENTVVGSGSLVMSDLPDHVLAYGSPAKIIRSRAAGEKFLKSL